MKAFLLAAGLGTRLRPLTNTIPKCMVPIQGRPLLAWWMDLFEQHHIREVLINTHYLPDPVRKFIHNYNAQHHAVTLVESYEKELLGSGGTVLANKSFVKDEKDFLICYADNLTDANLTEMIEFHRQHTCVITMGLFRTNNPKGCGIASCDAEGNIIEFEEKPVQPKSNLANAGIYIANQCIYKYLPQREFLDFGKDVIPMLIGKMVGYPIRQFLLDIGTKSNYEKAQEEWHK